MNRINSFNASNGNEVDRIPCAPQNPSVKAIFKRHSEQIIQEIRVIQATDDFTRPISLLSVEGFNAG